MPYPKRLIEVDLPIARISAHARREKSIRHGHISTLHIWWARRPVAACRAVICAALWPDPGDPLCPVAFREAAIRVLTAFARRVNPERITDEKRKLQEGVSEPSHGMWEALAAGTMTLDAHVLVDGPILRNCLLHFIADFANWDNSTVPAYLETARMLTAVAHASLSDPSFQFPTGEEADRKMGDRKIKRKSQGQAEGDGADSVAEASSFCPTSFCQPLPPASFFAALPRPLVVDPFCGGGSIPLEALRVGADAFASDLNPVPVLLNKVVLEYIPKYGKRLAEEVRKWGAWIKQEAEKELAEFYPKDPDGATPIAYLWARTIRCEGPACGAEVPLIRSLWLAKKAHRSVALRLIPNPQEKRVDFDIFVKQRDGWVSQSDSSFILPPSSFSSDGTVKRGSATCPCCGYTTPNERVRFQLSQSKGGATTARMMAVVMTRQSEAGRLYRLPSDEDLRASMRATERLKELCRVIPNGLSIVPDELIPTERPSPNARGLSAVTRMGVASFGDLFAQRQALALVTFSRLVRNLSSSFAQDGDRGEAEAVGT